ncbi:PDR/VanB family oxidoreductase [Halomonas kalidii]|uniref:PDR/VanB family oxidoreductase n=1 Tax=Halomonas kalidii TaxID=3043293 RepID=A0ABT6VJC5_9GAMM|nr:PDR/VanB family oxidoreductase [Halomonas kalidii]MDI5933790.1 PDR/VanB family oxidoreductase [Halomonas kalidii]
MNISAANIIEYEPVQASAGNEQKKLKVILRSITYLAEGIKSFEFVAPDRGELPPFIAGSHIDVHLPDGVIRQYSLCNPPADTQRYVVAVLRETNGRGGSITMHDRLSPGDEVTISRPRNHFSLADDARRHIFVAGGIGITPIMSMLAEVISRHEPFHLYYCTRTRERTAFIEDLQAYITAEQVTLHHDGGDPHAGLDLPEILGQHRPGDHLYYCGPSGFMDAVETAAAHWAPETVHYERFSAPAVSAASEGFESLSQSFDVKLSRTGEVFHVEAGKTIVEVLEDNGVVVDVSCEEGYCGTCMTRYLEGHPIHNDTVLDDQDRQDYIMVCCARSNGGCLVLDL